MQLPTPKRWLPWAAGAAGAVVVIGPGLNRGAWINLDQTVLPHLPIPTVLLGVGPDIPRRGPFTLLGALGSPWGASALVMKLLVVVALAAATAGMARRLVSLGPMTAVGAGLLYAFGPFLMGRLAVGHLGLLWAAAVIPWALPALARSAGSPARAFLWSLLAACGGYLSGTIVLALVPVLAVLGVAPESPGGLWARIRGAAAVGAAQSLWLVPGVAVAASVGFDQPGGEGFRLALSGWAAPARLLIGEGYFHTEAGSVPLPGAWGAVLGLVVGALAVTGLVVHRRPDPTDGEALGGGDVAGGGDVIGRLGRGWSLALVVVIGLLVPLSGLFDATAGLWADLSDVQPFNLAREPHRLFLVAWLVIVPAVAWGVRSLGERRAALEPLAAVTPLVLALVLVAPQAWGMEGQLRGVELPDAWAEVRAAVRADPGTATTAPAVNYAFWSVGDVRRAYNPWPDYLGVDTVISSDAKKGPTSEVDPRMDVIGPALRAYSTGRRGALVGELRRAGVRWLIVPAVASGDAHPNLGNQPGLEAVVVDPAVQLYRVTGGSDPARAASPWPGLWRRVSPQHGAVIADAAAPGWRVGLTGPAPTGPGGRFVIPSGSAWAWFPAMPLTAVSQLVLIACALWAARRIRTERTREVDVLESPPE